MPSWFRVLPSFCVRSGKPHYPRMKSNFAGLLFVLFLIVHFGLAAWADDGKVQYAARKQSTLTFNKDVAPIVFRHCAGCHRPRQAAPFNLLIYADLKKRAKQV